MKKQYLLLAVGFLLLAIAVGYYFLRPGPASGNYFPTDRKVVDVYACLTGRLNDSCPHPFYKGKEWNNADDCYMARCDDPALCGSDTGEVCNTIKSDLCSCGFVRTDIVLINSS